MERYTAHFALALRQHSLLLKSACEPFPTSNGIRLTTEACNERRVFPQAYLVWKSLDLKYLPAEAGDYAYINWQ